MTQLPPSLVRFRSQLEDAIRADTGTADGAADLAPSAVRLDGQLGEAIDRRRRRRRTGVRAAALAAAALIATAVVVVGEPFGGESSASAVERAQEAVAGSDGEILHVVAVTTRSGPGGVTDVSRSEMWQQNAAPYDHREIGFGADGARGRELGTAQGRPQYYDPVTDTIHTTSPDVEVSQSSGLNGELTGQGFVDRMRVLMKKGAAHEDGHVNVDGRDAIRIVADALTLIVDADTFQPIEWRLDGEAAGGRYDASTTRIETYEWLPDTPANRALFSLDAQHPGAEVVTDVTVGGFDEPKGS
jgi:hypothetical protein